MSRGQKRYAAEQKRNTYSQRHRRSPSIQTRRMQQNAKMHRDKLKRRQQAQLPSDYKKHQTDDSSSSSDSIPDTFSLFLDKLLKTAMEAIYCIV